MGDGAEARWRFTRAAKAGDSQAKFMVEHGLAQEMKTPDKAKLEKLERCWSLAGQRIASMEDHQTLRAIYKMSEMEYLARKAPALVSSCYWRVQATQMSRRLSAEEMESLFGGDKESRPPGLTPRL